MRRTDKNNIKEKSRIVIVKEKVKCVRGRPVNRMIKAAAKFKGLDKAKRYEDDKTPADDAESCAAEIARAAFYFEPQRRTGISRSISKLHKNSAAQQKMRRKTAVDKARQACKPNELTADNYVQQKIKTDTLTFHVYNGTLPEKRLCCYSTLSKMEAELDSQGFVRLHVLFCLARGVFHIFATRKNLLF